MLTKVCDPARRCSEHLSLSCNPFFDVPLLAMKVEEENVVLTFFTTGGERTTSLTCISLFVNTRSNKESFVRISYSFLLLTYSFLLLLPSAVSFSCIVLNAIVLKWKCHPIHFWLYFINSIYLKTG